MRIDEGRFGEVTLDGLCWVGLFAWPKAIHEGNGECLPVVDERADARQREALLTIFSGQESEPGATVFQVLSTTLTKMHDPLFKPIRFASDMAAGTGHFAVEGLIEAEASPITNPVTGVAHRANVRLPTGFEYVEAEFVSSRTKAQGAIALGWATGHGHLSLLHMTREGPVRA